MKNKFIITFAGAPGSSKTPIANYLSQVLSLPLFNTDAIRKEIAEDNLRYDINKFQKLRDERLRKLITKGNSFILDASVDRSWQHYKEMIGEDFQVFIISMDLSKNLLEKLHKSKIYVDTIALNPDKWISDHDKFIEQFGNLVNLTITDKTFRDRLKLSEEKIKEWISKN